MPEENPSLCRNPERYAVVPLLLLLTACATPAGDFRADATARGLATQVAQSDALGLVLFRKGRPKSGMPLHIYLDGDGMPWASRRRVARDPTSREHLILDLVEQDAAASVLVGRPCYYQDEHGCDPALWTAQRYGESVVAAMASTINHEIARAPEARVTLIGYSGGGALAMLLATHLSRVDALITVAANLDVAAWARHHGYTPLTDSLDPATMPPLPAHIRQLHFFGEHDNNVPAELMRHVADKQANASVRIVPEFDHRCCWARMWPQLLAEVR